MSYFRVILFIITIYSIWKGNSQALIGKYTTKNLRNVPTLSPDDYLDSGNGEGDDSNQTFTVTGSTLTQTSGSDESQSESTAIPDPVTQATRINIPSTSTQSTSSELITQTISTISTTQVLTTQTSEIITTSENPPSTTRSPKQLFIESNALRFKGRKINPFDKKIPPFKLPSTTEATINGNYSLKLDLLDYARSAKLVIEKFYQILSNPSLQYPVRSEFKETYDFYYTILSPEMSFSSARQSCLLRKSQLYEVSSYLRLLQLRSMSNNKGINVEDLDSENWSILIWLNIYPDEDGTLVYQSGDPLYTMHDEFGTLELPNPPTKGNCIAFDILATEYTSVSCETELYALCFRRKSPELMQKINVLDHLRDRTNELNTLKLILNSKPQELKDKDLIWDQCPPPTSSLSKTLGLDEPVNFLRQQTFQGIDLYYDHYERFKEDVEKYRFLTQPSFSLNLKELMVIDPEATVIYQKGGSVICIFPNVKLTTESPTSPPTSPTITTNPPKLETVKPGEIEPDKKIVITPAPTSKPIPDTTKPPVTETPRTTERPTIPTSQTPSTSNSTASNDTERYVINTKYIKITFYESVIASTSVTIALIAVCNCAWVIVLLVKRRRATPPNEETIPADLELTPMLNSKPKVKFGSDQIREFSPYNSIGSLPSPTPIVRGKKNK
jgi:hypothetical protein